MIDERRRFERAFEQFEMPEPAFERMLGRHDRRRQAHRLSAALLALVLAVVAIGVVVRAFGSGRQTGRQTPDVVDPRTTLTRILPSRTSDPGRMTFTSESAGVSGVTRPLQRSPLEQSRAVQIGFVDAMVHEFSAGEDVFLGALAAAYRDAAAAQDALRVFRTGFRTDYSYVDPPTNAGLGADSFLFRETVGSPTYTCLWRRGNLILNVHVVGEVDAGLVLAVAEAMDARVQREGSD